MQNAKCKLPDGLARTVSADVALRRADARFVRIKFERRGQIGVLAKRKVCARCARTRGDVHVWPTARPKPKCGRQLRKVRIEKCGGL
jgi:hypothetical protein